MVTGLKHQKEKRSMDYSAGLDVSVKDTSVNGRAANNIAPIIAELQAGGATSLQDIAARLNQRGITTARGGTWSAKQVARVFARRTATK